MKKVLKKESDPELRYKVLIIYDITEDKCRVKLAKYLASYGVRVQKSAFEAKLNKKQYEKLIFGLERFVGREDSIRLYKFYEDNEVITYGKADMNTFEEVVVI